MKNAIDISMDELSELNAEFDEFVKRVSHLTIFEHLYKAVIEPYWSKLDADARHLIKKNYTTEELELMPKESYKWIVKEQRTRLELLKSIAIKYNLRIRK